MSEKRYYEHREIQRPTYSINLTLDYFNKRLRVTHFLGSSEEVIKKTVHLMCHHSFEKLIFYIRKDLLLHFLTAGFSLEAILPRYFNGSDAYIVTKYFSKKRRISINWEKEDEIIRSLHQDENEISSKFLETTSPPFTLRKAITSDAKKLACLYQEVFKIYPTPLDDEEYIIHLLKGSSVYYVIEENNEIISAASVDINYAFHNAELTDCATLPQYRGYGFMKSILKKLEQELVNNGIFCAFSIARSLSFGMNACFHNLGYTYTGRLINNCYIYDKLEDMNVWVKDLSQQAK